MNRLPYLFGVVLVAACGEPKTDEVTTTVNNDDSSSGGGTTLTTSNTTNTTNQEESSSSGTPSSSSDSGGEVTTTTNGDTGDPECGPGIGCGVAAPAGWFGPMIIASGDGSGESPVCPEGYVDGPVALEGFIDPGPAVCNCECTLGAANCTAYAYSHNSASCSTYNYTNVSDTCTNFSVPGYAQFYMYSNGNPSCTSEKSEEFPPAQWETQIHTCKLADGAESCNGDGICQPSAPDGFEATSCIYQQGDVGCPAGVYNTKHLYNSGVDDTRDCGDCTCGIPQTTCSGDMMVFAQEDCPGEPAALVPSDYSCHPATGVAVAVDLSAGGECPVASQPHSEGEVKPVGAFTFCCMGI